MKKIILFLSLCLTAANVYAGSIQLSTYYPSPFGYYERLKFNPRASLAEPCEPGTVYYLAGTGLRYCAEDTLWKSMGDGVWTQSGDLIYPADTATNPSLKVGIGTTAPNRELDVNGTIRLRGHFLIGDPDPTNNAVFVAPNNGWQGFVFRTPPIGVNLDDYDGSTFTDLMTISPSGNVGIGIITPNNLIQVKELINFDNARYGTSLGYQAGLVNTGYYNTFVGYQSGISTSGDKNTFVGNHSGQSNSSGNYNTFLGHNAGNTTTTGDSNTLIGHNSGYSSTNGTNNTFVGQVSGYSNTSGGANTFIGQASGWNNTTGYNNVFLGLRAGWTNTTGYNNIIIGTAIDAPSPTTSNFLTIGGIINGDLTTGNVGIGTTNPSSASLQILQTGNYEGLRVDKSGGAANWAADIRNSDTNNGSGYGLRVSAGNGGVNDSVFSVYNYNGLTIFFHINGQGDVGIGTTPLGYKLEVAGQIRATGGTPIYQCPNGDPDYNRNQCVGQLSTTNPTCLYVDGAGEYTANCALVGRMVAP